MRLVAVIGAMLLMSALPAASAFAQQGYPGVGQSTFNLTADSTSFTPSPPTPDGRGNIAEMATSSGNLSGSPFSGTFQVQEVRLHSPADGSSGTVQGQFTLRDGSGNTISGNLSGDYSVAASSSSASGQYTITGGTGAYAGAMGSGSFTELLALPDGTPTLTFAGSWSGQPGSPAASRVAGTALPAGYNLGTAPGTQIVYVPVEVSGNNLNLDDDRRGELHVNVDGNGNVRVHRDNGQHKGQRKHDD